MNLQLEQLDSVTGQGTSCITLIIPAEENLTLTTSKLNKEIAASENIKSRV